MADDDLTVILSKRSVKAKRAKSTSALIVAIIFMAGMLVGVVLGRATSAPVDSPPEQGMLQGPPD